MGGHVCASGDRTPMQPRTFFKRRARELREDMPTPIHHGWTQRRVPLQRTGFSPRSCKVLRPYFVRDYNKLVRALIANEPDYAQAMAKAVGGAYVETGRRERRILESLGLRGTDYVIDIGAGSGRLATAMNDMPSLQYLGTDVVPELLDFARHKCGREDWAFKLVKAIEIPERDGVADFVVFFSVFTHLKEKESFRYLQEAKRVLKRNGIIIVSYLNPEVAIHVSIVKKWWVQLRRRLRGKDVLNKLLSKEVLKSWSKELNLSVEFLESGDLGSSLCAYRFPQSPSG
jgi:ubiquinone/menaquinone biosynthesis C-methylase UbiE